MAMLPFIGYNIRDYLVHWFRMRKKMKDCRGFFTSTGFARTIRANTCGRALAENVLSRIIDRCHGRAYAAETTLGMDAARRISIWRGSISTSTISAPCRRWKTPT